MTRLIASPMAEIRRAALGKPRKTGRGVAEMRSPKEWPRQGPTMAAEARRGGPPRRLWPRRASAGRPAKQRRGVDQFVNAEVEMVEIAERGDDSGALGGVPLYRAKEAQILGGAPVGTND